LGELLLWALFLHPHIRVVHLGRRSGRRRQTVLEVIRFDPQQRERIVAAMFGPGSDWYRNLQAAPAIEVEADGTIFQPQQRVLGNQAAQAELDDYRRRNPIWSKVVGTLIRRPFTSSSMPVVVFSQVRVAGKGR
jgi:deazaflavin-dependent oxidoreductase (nitroreductase family)